MSLLSHAKQLVRIQHVIVRMCFVLCDYFTLVSGCVKGQATDIQIQAEEILKLKRQINNIYVKHTKQPLVVVG